MHLQEQSYKGREGQKSGDALAHASARMPGLKLGGRARANLDCARRISRRVAVVLQTTAFLEFKQRAVTRSQTAF